MPHCIIGLRILNELVEEVNSKVHTRSVTEHRRVAVSFRDQCLLSVFEIALAILNQVATRQLPLSGMDAGTANHVENKILEQALALANACLGFDFIGTNPSESTENVGSLQVPTSWRDKFEKPDYLTMLFSLYEGAATGQIRLRDASGSLGAPSSMVQNATRAAQVLEVLTHYTSARRSVFRSDSSRKQFLLLTMSGIVNILKSRVGLNQGSCYHRFCQLLGRLKANYQLSELVRVDGYHIWLELTAQFTQESLENLHALSDSIHYLLMLWSKMVSAVPYVRRATPGSGSSSSAATQPGETLLDRYAPGVLKKYLEVRLALAAAAEQGTVENADLDDAETAVLQAEQLPGLFRFQYADSVATLASALDTLSTKHESLSNIVGSAVLQGAAAAASDPNFQAAKTQLSVVEAQLAWLVYMVGAIIGDSPFGSSTRSPGDERRDAELCKRVIALMQSVNARLTKTEGVVKCDYRLEMASLYFLAQFRKTFFVESRGMPAPPPAIGAAGTQPLLDATAADAAESGRGGGPDPSPTRSGFGGERMSSVMSRAAERQTAKQKLFDSMFAEMGLGDHLVVASFFIAKLASNLKFWPGSQEVLGQTLDVFQAMTHSYSSGKLLLALEVVNKLLLNHTSEHFRFLEPLENGRLRTRFYMCVARLLYISEDPDVMFERFMSPLASAMDRVKANISVKSSAMGLQVAGVCRDLRGVIAAAHNPRTYTLVFEVLYPQYFDMFVAAVTTWADEPQVTTPLLKMLAELVHNRAHRISFGASSPNGILLFREISKVAVAYGQQLAAMAVPAQRELWQKRYKGLSVLLTMMARILDGSYVNFGVFDLYEDPSLQNALETVLQLALSVPDADLVAFPKLSRSFYYLVHVLTKSHLKRLVGIPTASWQRIMAAVRDGLETHDPTIANHAAYALDYTATAFVQHFRKDSVLGNALRAQVSAERDLFHNFMKLLFQLVVFGDLTTQWAMTRPMLPLVLAADMVEPRTWDRFKEALVMSQPVEGGVRARLVEEMGKLMKDVTRSLDSPNRDRFSKHLSSFRTAVREFVTL